MCTARLFSQGVDLFALKFYLDSVVPVYHSCRHILYSKYHVLHAILPGRSDSNYNLRPRRHNLVLTAKSFSVTDRDFITRMIYKDTY